MRVLLLVLIAGEALAAPVREVVVTERTLTINGHDIKLPYVTLPSPTLTGSVNASIAGAWGVLGAAADPPRKDEEITCGLAIATDRVISWVCSGMLAHGGVSAGHADGGALVIEGDQTKTITLPMLFGANAPKLSTLTGKRGGGDSDCKADLKDTMLFSSAGLELVPSGDNKGCLLGWDQLKPLLVPKSFMLDVLDHFGCNPSEPNDCKRLDDPRSLWAKAPARYVAQADGVLDHVSGLVWALADNGADVTFDQADKFARAFRAGNHSDWRLPTEVELEIFSQPEGAHREKTDCTKGAYDLLATPLVKLSCGLAWTSTLVGKDRAVAFGFISGTSRVLAKTEKKNARALVVRTP